MKLINGQKLTLITDYNIARTFFIDEWIFPILNMFSMETFLELFTLIMLEDRIVFVCENSHILTYTIYLFAYILVRPFVYSFPVINIIPNEEFLNAPFPVVYGLLKKKKYVEDMRLVEKYSNTYVFLSPEKVELVYSESKKSLLKRKPVKLKTELSPFFRDMKKQRKTEKNSRYEIQIAEYCVMSTSEEREISISIVEKVGRFVKEELMG